MPSHANAVVSKGQLPLPEAVRKHLQVRDGDPLEFTISSDGTVTLHAPGPDLAALYGCLPSPAKRISLAEMEQGLGEALAAEDGRIRRGEG